MDVRCPQCDTLYEIDARQLRGGAATLKCSQCDHVFRLKTQAALIQENQRRWMVKNTSSGDVHYFVAFDELHQWILEGKVGKSDQLSRTGKKWKRLGSIGEFMPIFQAVESISNINASRAAQQRAESSAPAAAPKSGQHSVPESSSPAEPPKSAEKSAADKKFRSKVPTSQQFKVDQESSPSKAKRAKASESHPPQPNHTPVQAQRSQTPAPPAQSGSPSESGRQVRLQAGAFGAGADQADDDGWSFGDGSAPLGEVEASGHFEPIEYEGGKSRWPVVLVVVVLLLGGAGAGVWFGRPDLVDKWLSAPKDDAVVSIKDEPSQADNAGEDAERSPDDRVAAALDEALVALERAHADQLGEAIASASPKLAMAVGRGDKKAKKAAEEPDAKELLASAKRYLERGRPRRARHKFHDVLELERRNVEAITGLGWSLLALSSPASASSQFRKALAIDSSHGDAYIGLGKAEREQGNAAAALEAYRDYLRRFPGGRKASIAEYQAKQLERALE